MDAAGRRPGPTRGFTLVELLTVVAIIAILMSLVVGAFTSVRARYQRDATLEVFRAIEAALQQYYSDWGMYPWPNDATAECEIDDPSKPSRKIKIMGISRSRPFSSPPSPPASGTALTWEAPRL